MRATNEWMNELMTFSLEKYSFAYEFNLHGTPTGSVMETFVKTWSYFPAEILIILIYGDRLWVRPLSVFATCTARRDSPVPVLVGLHFALSTWNSGEKKGFLRTRRKIYFSVWYILWSFHEEKGKSKRSFKGILFSALDACMCGWLYIAVHMVSTGCRLPVALKRIVDLSCNLMEVLN